MPRPKKPEQQPQHNSLVASAARVTTRRKRGKPKSTGATAWQDEAWQMLNDVGELEFYREWISNALSRVTLRVVQEVGGEKKPVTEGLAYDALQTLFGGEQGQSQMLAAFAGHLSVPGETWLVGLLEPSDELDAPDMWRVLDRSEITEQGTRLIIDRGDGEPESYEDGSGGDDKPAEVLAIRIWRSHPRRWVEAHSSVRSALPILRELLGLTKHVAASIDSRLAGAGILFVPQEMTFSPLPGQEASADDDVDPFIAALTEAMTTAIRDRGDASAVVPLVVKAPAQYLEKIKHLTFWSEFAGEALELRKEAITRLAASLDVPAEVLTGMADVNHWTGWLLDDNAIKMHVEPLVELICHALSTKYLHAILSNPEQPGSMAVADARTFSLEGDTSALRMRPNRTAEFQAMHAAMIITDAALARETGVEAGDLLSDPSNADELRRRLLMKTAGGVTTADVTVAALSQLGISLVPKPSEVAQTEPAVAAPAPAAELPGPEATPPAPETRNPPEQAALVALVLGSEAVVLRAVEKAWNRAGKRRGTRAAIDADQLDASLAGAWDYAERIAAMTGVDHDRLVHALDGYTRTMLATGAEHSPMTFATMLRDQVLTAPPGVLGG